MSWLRDWVVSSGAVRMVVVVMLPVLGPAACAPPAPPIRLNPTQAIILSPPLPPRRVMRAVPAPVTASQPARAARQPEEAGEQACASPALQGLTPPRKAELFRRFAELEGRPVGDAPVPAGLPACPPGSR